MDEQAFKRRVAHVRNMAKKTHTQDNEPMLSRVILNTLQLSRAGMQVPTTLGDTATSHLYMPWLRGQSAKQLFINLRRQPGFTRWSEVSWQHLYFLVQPLVALHIIAPRLLDIDELRPWRHITPRLNNLRKGALVSISPKQQRVTYDKAMYCSAKLAAMGKQLQRISSARQVPVHGDYHIGQLIIDPNGKEPWLLDWDDLATGQPESDVGNFVAHCVTTPELALQDTQSDFFQLLTAFVAGYQRLSIEPLALPWVRHFGAIALLRRALKLFERGNSGPESEALQDAIFSTIALAIAKNQAQLAGADSYVAD